MNLTTFAVAAVILAVIAPVDAHAYLDPGAGSMLIQLVLGGVAGAAVILKLYWATIREKFGSKPKQDNKKS